MHRAEHAVSVSCCPTSTFLNISVPWCISFTSTGTPGCEAKEMPRVQSIRWCSLWGSCVPWGRALLPPPHSGLALHLLQDHVQLLLPLLLASPLNFFPLLASGLLLVLFLIVDFNPVQWALVPPAPFLLVVSACLFSWLCRPSWLIHPLRLPPACGDAPACSSSLPPSASVAINPA